MGQVSRPLSQRLERRAQIHRRHRRRVGDAGPRNRRRGEDRHAHIRNEQPDAAGLTRVRRRAGRRRCGRQAHVRFASGGKRTRAVPRHRSPRRQGCDPRKCQRPCRREDSRWQAVLPPRAVEGREERLRRRGSRVEQSHQAHRPRPAHQGRARSLDATRRNSHRPRHRRRPLRGGRHRAARAEPLELEDLLQRL